MQLLPVTSYNDLQDVISKEIHVFAILIKQHSESSICARKELTEAFKEDDKAVCLVEIDVERTKDIHGVYGVDSVPSILVFKEGKLENVVKGCMNKNYYKSLAEEHGKGRSDVSGAENKIPEVIVYSTPTCSWCTRLKDHLKRNNIRYREFDVASNPSAGEEMRRKSGQMGVPQTEINGQMIVGFDKAKIDRLLGIGN